MNLVIRGIFAQKIAKGKAEQGKVGRGNPQALLSPTGGYAGEDYSLGVSSPVFQLCKALA
jgi:hypothetical protein